MTPLLHRGATRFVGPILTGLLAALPLLAAPASVRAGEKDSPVDPRLVGSWHAEVQTSVLVDDVTLIVLTTYDVTIDADGGASYRSVTIESGRIDNDIDRKTVNADYTGTVVQRGNVLIATTKDGKEYRIKFRLSGNNGLYLDGRLFEKK
jgi:hypothetical protein